MEEYLATLSDSDMIEIIIANFVVRVRGYTAIKTATYNINKFIKQRSKL